MSKDDRYEIPSDGSCPKCRAPDKEFVPVFGGSEVCGKCGYTRKGTD